MGKQLGFITDNGRWLSVKLEGRRESEGGVFFLSSSLAGENALANLPLPKGRVEVEGWDKKRRQRGEGGQLYPPQRQSLSALIHWGCKQLGHKKKPAKSPITFEKLTMKGKRSAYKHRLTEKMVNAKAVPDQDWVFTLRIDFLKPRLESQP
jgi:hypothetical protein